MKKKFVLNVMYGDDDGRETFTYTTDIENEINFFTYFLENYTEDVFDFYDCPKLLKYNKSFKDDKISLINIVNMMADLENQVEFEDIQPLPDDATVEDIHESLSGIIDFIDCYFGWFMYHSGMDYNGCPVSYSIEDITDCKEMTKQEVKQMVEDKLGIKITIID